MVRELWGRSGRVIDHGSRVLLVGGVLLVAGSGGPLRSGEDRSTLGGPATVRAGSPDEAPIVLAAVTQPASVPFRQPAPALEAAPRMAEPVAAPPAITAPDAPMSGAAPALDTWQDASVQPAAAGTPEPRSDWAAATIVDLVPEGPKPQIAPPLPPRAIAKVVPNQGMPKTVLGTWVPNRDACQEPGSSDYLPLVIGRTSAKAGEGSCAFLQHKQVGKAVKITAECTDGTTDWTANITLSVVNRRLTWTSERGTETYERCERASVVAAAKKPERVAAAKKPARVARADTKKATVRITTGAGPAQVVTVLRR